MRVNWLSSCKSGLLAWNLYFIGTIEGLLMNIDLYFLDWVRKGLGQTGLLGCNCVLHREVL
jgi:hypothetical protein